MHSSRKKPWFLPGACKMFPTTSFAVETDHSLLKVNNILSQLSGGTIFSKCHAKFGFLENTTWCLMSLDAYLTVQVFLY